METLKYKGYTGSVDFSVEENGLFGKVLGMPKASITFEGTNVKELLEDFHEAIDDYLKECEDRGLTPVKPFSGNLNIRIPHKVHEEIAIHSKSEGISINAYIKNALERQLKMSY